jgi:hypothetical protein
VTHEPAEAIGEVLKMVFSLGEQNGRTAFLNGGDDIVDD